MAYSLLVKPILVVQHCTFIRIVSTFDNFLSKHKRPQSKHNRDKRNKFYIRFKYTGKQTISLSSKMQPERTELSNNECQIDMLRANEKVNKQR